jgi:AbiV family abortive infection protein
MIKERKYTITDKLLRSYKNNAIKNSELLLEESKILLSNNKWPGAYFLACASIEETGKAFLAFHAVNRNLSNPAIQRVLKMDFENHQVKMTNGLSALLLKAGNTEKNIKYFLDLNLNLSAGREKSLYADIRDDNTLTLPKELVRPIAARNAVRLAENSLSATNEYFVNSKPKMFSQDDDKFLLISKKYDFQKMMGLPDFWWFYIDNIKTFNGSETNHWSIAVSKYWDEYFSKNKLWDSARAILDE